MTLEFDDFDDFDDDDEMEEDDKAQARREKAQAIAKALTSTKKENKELVKRLAIVEAAQAKRAREDMAKRVGISPAAAALYDGDLEDDESMREWATEHDIETATPKTFVPGGFGTSDGDETLQGASMMSTQDAVTLYRTNPDRVLKLLQAGRVDGVLGTMADVDMDFDEQYFSVPRDTG
jgi:NADH dehydrogenase/NADH:ubiquinone oxidoreductase subunit G